MVHLRKAKLNKNDKNARIKTSLISYIKKIVQNNALYRQKEGRERNAEMDGGPLQPGYRYHRTAGLVGCNLQDLTSDGR